MKQRILFVCLGNICRSPLAEGILRHLSQAGGQEIEIASAGTGRWHVGEPPDHRSIKVARDHGIDIAGQRCRTVARDDFDTSDLIFGMDGRNVANLLAMAPRAAHGRIHLFMDFTMGTPLDVPDPYHDGPEGFEAVYSMLFAGCSSLIGRLERFS